MATIKTKYYFAEQIQLKINPDRPKDERLGQQEIINVMDQTMNFLASINFTENFMLYGSRDVADQYIATFENIAFTDSSTHSELTLPSGYADLPRNQGIYEVIPTTGGMYERFFVRKSRNMRRNQNLMEGSMETRTFCFPQGDKLMFNKNNLKVVYKTATIRLVVTDASTISDAARYPIPPNKEKEFIDLVYEYFTQGTIMGEDPLNDDVKMK